MHRTHSPRRCSQNPVGHRTRLFAGPPTHRAAAGVHREVTPSASPLPAPLSQTHTSGQIGSLLAHRSTSRRTRFGAMRICVERQPGRRLRHLSSSFSRGFFFFAVGPWNSPGNRREPDIYVLRHCLPHFPRDKTRKRCRTETGRTPHFSHHSPTPAPSTNELFSRGESLNLSATMSECRYCRCA